MVQTAKQVRREFKRDDGCNVSLRSGNTAQYEMSCMQGIPLVGFQLSWGYETLVSLTCREIMIRVKYNARIRVEIYFICYGITSKRSQMSHSVGWKKQNEIPMKKDRVYIALTSSVSYFRCMT